MSRWNCSAKAGLALWVFFMASCAPYQNLRRIQMADATLETAGLIQAGEKAPYEFVKAGEYLHQAKMLMARSQYEQSLDFAKKAQFFAEESMRVAERRATGRE